MLRSITNNRLNISYMQRLRRNTKIISNKTVEKDTWHNKNAKKHNQLDNTNTNSPPKGNY